MLHKFKTVGERIQARREELKMSKADLARAAKCSNSAVGQWEKGDTKNLKLDNLFAVADALKISARELAIGAPEKPTGLAPDEAEMLEKYQRASPRWRLSLRLLADVQDEDQNEVSESVNVLMAKIFAHPATDARVAQAYGRPGHQVQQSRGAYAIGKKRRFVK